MENRILSVSRKATGTPDNFPFINLSGKWLEKLGFTIGEKVLVQTKKGNIQIRAINFTDQEEGSDCAFKVCE